MNLVKFKEKIQVFFANPINAMLGLVLLVIVVGGIFGISKLLVKSEPQSLLPELDLPFTPDGPYAQLLPRRDGNALILNIYRVSSYDAISYELAYQSQNEAGESVDRGVTGNLNTKDKKSDYSQEILFGTCSKGNTMDPLHCVFDKNVENGT